MKWNKHMKRRTYLIIIFVIIFLLSGLFLFRTLNVVDPSVDPSGEFRTWFWDRRALDLAVQVLLVFAGALGIAAILPVEEEDD